MFALISNCALTELEMQPLSDRRKDLCKNFAKKSYKSEKYNTWFVPRNNQTTVHTRSEKSKILPVQTRTKRYEKSLLPYLTGLLNETRKLPWINVVGFLAPDCKLLIIVIGAYSWTKYVTEYIVSCLRLSLTTLK